MNRKHREKYQILLDKFCGVQEILELIEECQIEDKGEREGYYLTHNQYPEQRDTLMKLKTDLIVNLKKEAK